MSLLKNIQICRHLCHPIVQHARFDTQIINTIYISMTANTFILTYFQRTVFPRTFLMISVLLQGLIRRHDAPWPPRVKSWGILLTPSNFQAHHPIYHACSCNALEFPHLDAQTSRHLPWIVQKRELRFFDPTLCIAWFPSAISRAGNTHKCPNII